MSQSTDSDPISVIERMFEAANRHDLDAFLAYFHRDYQSVAPLHPKGNRFDLRGVIIHGIEASQIKWARLYMEPVEAEMEPR